MNWYKTRGAFLVGFFIECPKGRVFLLLLHERILNDEEYINKYIHLFIVLRYFYIWMFFLG